MGLKVRDFTQIEKNDIEINDVQDVDALDDSLSPIEDAIQPPVETVEPTEVETQIADGESHSPTENINSTSSLTEDSSVQSEPVKPEVTDELVLSYLKDKGIEVQSFDELTKPVAPVAEEDPYIKELKAWRERTNRPIEDWVKFQNLKTLKDDEVAREYLRQTYPDFTEAEINDELSEFLPNEYDSETEANKKAREFKKLVIQGKKTLESLAVEFQQPNKQALPVEVQKDLELLNQFKSEYSKSTENVKKYQSGIESVAKAVTALPLKLSDQLSIDFKLTDVDKKELPTYISQMSHWRNEDGSDNHGAIVSDAIKIKYFDKIVGLIYEQGLNAGKEQLLNETSNVKIQTRDNAVPTGEKGIKVDQTLDQYFGSSNKLKFRNF